MNLKLFSYDLIPPVKLRLLTVRARDSPGPTTGSIVPRSLRLQVLERVDEELRKGNEKRALALVKDAQGKPGGLCGFGAVRQVGVLIRLMYSNPNLSFHHLFLLFLLVSYSLFYLPFAGGVCNIAIVIWFLLDISNNDFALLLEFTDFLPGGAYFPFGMLFTV